MVVPGTLYLGEKDQPAVGKVKPFATNHIRPRDRWKLYKLIRRNDIFVEYEITFLLKGF